MAKVASVACLKWHQRQDPEHLHSPPLSKNIHNWTIDCNLDWHGMLGFATTIPIVCALTPKKSKSKHKNSLDPGPEAKKTSTCDNEGQTKPFAEFTILGGSCFVFVPMSAGSDL